MTYQEKRNRTLFISLIAISAITIFYYWFSIQEKLPVDIDTFRVPDLTSIDRVTLEKDGKVVDLKYDGVRWNVDDELADRNMVDLLFATLEQAKPLRPVAPSVRDSVIRQLNKEGVTVSLYADEDNVLTFLAGGNPRKSQAYFQKEGEREVYIMTIPGYRVYVSGIFELDKSGWKDKYVFQFNWRNFQSLHAQFPQSPKDDFHVRLIDKYFSIEGMASVDTTRLNDFLDAVSLLTVDGYEEGRQLPGSMPDSTPTMVISVKDVAGREYSLALYAPSSSASPVNGLINSTQYAVFNRNKINPVFRDRNFFNQEK